MAGPTDTCELKHFATRPLVFLDISCTLTDASRILVRNNVTSAPVRDARKDEWVMLVDQQLLAVAGLSFVEEDLKQATFADKSARISAALSKASLGMVHSQHVLPPGLSPAKPFYTVELSSTIREALGEFCKYLTLGRSVYRVVIVDNGEPVGILSQSCLVRHYASLLERPDSPPALLTLGDQTVEALGVANINPGTELLTAPATWSLLRCLKLLQSKKMRSLCVVDSDGRFQFPLSFSLVQRFLQDEAYSVLSQSAGEFCAQNLPCSAQEAKAINTAALQMKFGDLVQRLAHHHLHRVYVLSPTGVPTGIVTLSDVLLAIHRVHV